MLPYPVLGTENYPRSSGGDRQHHPHGLKVHHNLHFDNVAELWQTLPHGIRESINNDDDHIKQTGVGIALCRFWHGWSGSVIL